MKRFLSPLLLAALPLCNVSAKVADSAAIAQFWNEYYELALQNGDRADYWQSEYNLIERYSLKDVVFDERYLPHRIGRIEALNDSMSVITVFTNSGSRREWYKVGVLRRAEGYKLVDYFQTIKGGLLREKGLFVDLYSLKRNVPYGNRIDRFVESLYDFYDFKPDGRRIEYFAGSDMQECLHTAGIGLGRGWRYTDSDGFVFFGSLVFTGKGYHPHELVHAVMIPRYPNAPSVLHEGLAVYHSRADREKHVRRFKRYIETHRTAAIEGIARYYGAGYLLIDHALRHYGPEKVLALLSHIDLDEALGKEFGVPRGEECMFFVSLLAQD